jgi:acyl carrier protein
MEMDDVEKQLLEAINARLRASPALSDELASLGVDSVKMADFIMTIEEQFDIRVDQDIWDVATVGELAAYIRTRQPPKA